MVKGAECKVQTTDQWTCESNVLEMSGERVRSLLALLMHLLVSAVSSQTDGVVLYSFGAVDNKPCSLYGLS